MSHDHHDHAHGDQHHDDVAPTRIVATAAANTGFAVVQVVVGLLIGSVAVLADAAHQAVDALGLCVAAAAVWLMRRPADHEMTFGWGKVDSLGAFVSGLLLLASTVWIVYESIGRLLEPQDVDGGGVIVIGIIAVIVNGVSLLLVGHGHDNLSLAAARLHLITDLAGSFIVVAAGTILQTVDWQPADPIASLILSALVLHATWNLLRRAARELLDRAPIGLDARTVDGALRTLPEVVGVHHLHLRSLGGREVSLTGHVVIDGDLTVHDAQERIESMIATLADHRITHSTLQIECHPCEAPEH